MKGLKAVGVRGSGISGFRIQELSDSQDAIAYRTPETLSPKP